MRKIAVLLSGILVGAAGLAGGRVRAAFQDEPKAAAPAPCWAVVNVADVFEKIPRSKRVFQDLQAQVDLLKSSLTEREGKLNKDAQDVDARFTPGTPDYENRQRDLALLKAGIDWDKRAGLQNLARKQATGMAQVYREITAEAERIAGEKGFAGVLNFNPEPIQVEDKGQVITTQELRLQMNLRTVLWARKDLDLTKDVIEALSK